MSSRDKDENEDVFVDVSGVCPSGYPDKSVCYPGQGEMCVSLLREDENVSG